MCKHIYNYTYTYTLTHTNFFFSYILMSVLSHVLLCKQNLSKKCILRSHTMIENKVCLKGFPKGLMVQLHDPCLLGI